MLRKQAISSAEDLTASLIHLACLVGDASASYIVKATVLAEFLHLRIFLLPCSAELPAVVPVN